MTSQVLYNYAVFVDSINKFYSFYRGEFISCLWPSKQPLPVSCNIHVQASCVVEVRAKDGRKHEKGKAPVGFCKVGDVFVGVDHDHWCAHSLSMVMAMIFMMLKRMMMMLVISMMLKRNQNHWHAHSIYFDGAMIFMLLKRMRTVTISVMMIFVILIFQFVVFQPKFQRKSEILLKFRILDGISIFG